MTPTRPVRGPARFREKDVVRVIKDARKSGRPVEAIVIDPSGHISVQYKEPAEITPPPVTNVVYPSEFTTGYVYFIAADEMPFVKVGYAGAVEVRLPGLQTGCPYRLKVMAAFHGNQEDEIRIHTILARYREMGEWFHLTPPVLRLIDHLHAQCGESGAIAPHIKRLKPL